MFAFTNKKFVIISVFLLTLPLAVLAVSEGELRNFNIDSSYDLYGRDEIEAQLIRITPDLYFYVEKSWWEKIDSQKQNDVRIALFELGEEFRNKIYPVLTANFGSEPKPGIDKDERITILIHPMISEAGGYFNSGDVYSRYQNPKSNEREMLYLNSQHIDSPQAKSFLAHEFLHLITINQKDLLRKVSEEIWLNELRAEYSPTLLGYDDVYQGSNLEKRVQAFLEKPGISLVKWENRKENYGAINLFSQYLTDHYGKKILVDSLQSEKVGIPSLEEALRKNGFEKKFSQIFADWLITLLINDCKVGGKYCYLNKNLKDFRIVPTIYYLPKTETVMTSYYTVPPWTPNWQRFVGGGREFSLEFDGQDSVEFEVPYLLYDLQNVYSIGFLVLDNQQKGELSLSQFSQKYSSLTILPFVKSEIPGSNSKEKTFSFSWKVAIDEKTENKKETELIKKLLTQIEELKKQIAEYQAKIATLLTEKNQQGATLCRFDNNLYYGILNNSEVRCLQEFLKTQGPEIYPEGLITGNFLSLTKAAVIRFQEKYAPEILSPLGFTKGTGYVGQMTRAKISQFLK